MARSSINTVTETTATTPASAIETLAAALKPHMGVDEIRVREIAAEVAGIASRRIDVVINGDTTSARQIENAHAMLEKALRIIARGHDNVYLVGPAGSGKTSIAEHIAKALGRKFGFLSLSQGVTETHLLGRILPQESGDWAYVPSQFVQMYRDGGVFLLDEIDAADPNLMVTINAALANGRLANPVSGELIERHADFVIVAAANTWGHGADSLYVGRNRLDASTLDRFVGAKLFIDYDTKLEKAIAAMIAGVDQAEMIVGAIRSLRERIAAARLQRVASTRLVKAVAMAVRAGDTVDAAIAEETATWSAADRAKL